MIIGADVLRGFAWRYPPVALTCRSLTGRPNGFRTGTMRGVALARPEGISDQHWASIEAHDARLDRACERSDRSGIVGAAKELCECVASVVCAEQAQTISTADDFGKLISAAHAALDRRPGRGAAVEGSVRLIAQTARTIVTALNSLRNEVGTGHGRPVTPVVTCETAAIAEHSARLWSAWALGRLDEVLHGEVPRLIHELEAGGSGGEVSWFNASRRWGSSRYTAKTNGGSAWQSHDAHPVVGPSSYLRRVFGPYAGMLRPGLRLTATA